MSRGFNFSAGPAILPEIVLQQAQEELLEWGDCGASVMEVSHRSKAFIRMAEEAEQDFRSLLGIDDRYAVLFVQGGATLQFAMVPMNLRRSGCSADYVITGSWGKKAYGQAQNLGPARIAAISEESGFHDIPDPQLWALDNRASYVHITPNETIAGVEYHQWPETGDVPLVGDFSSTLLSRPLDVSRFGLFYAGAQKNIGPAGLTMVVIKKELLENTTENLPDMLSYSALAGSGSMLNTPPTFAWYLAGLVFKWLVSEGGVAEMDSRSSRKAELLYNAIDRSDFYYNPVAESARSRMNIPFTLANATLDSTFLEQAESEGLLALKGHRSVGGIRASLYNAMPVEGAEALVAFMQNFEKKMG